MAVAPFELDETCFRFDFGSDSDLKPVSPPPSRFALTWSNGSISSFSSEAGLGGAVDHGEDSFDSTC